jgi:hypothetical protein
MQQTEQSSKFCKKKKTGNAMLPMQYNIYTPHLFIYCLFNNSVTNLHYSVEYYGTQYTIKYEGYGRKWPWHHKF